MRCVGDMKDINGKLFYDGDVVKIGNRVKQVEYVENLARFDFLPWETGDNLKYEVEFHAANVIQRKIEVVGNIYENSELLEGESV
jgi:uncharacterized phage protein (TIGR01671 family)